jgi:RNA-directed DNA polymerase
MSTGLELRTRHQSNLLSTYSLVNVRPRVATALEDKILQRAVVEVLNAIYEQDFVGFSYGFRPGRSPHDALDALATGITRKRVNWVLDADFRDYFSSLDHQSLERFVEHRIADKRVLRLIKKWLGAGVIEDRTWTACEEGVPQGASASPLLANIYLHYVFDLWAHQWRTRHAHGDVVIVRFADDFVVGFEYRDDAERFWADLRDRLAKFSLGLNAEKTRLVRFGRFAAQQCQERGLGKPETFRFLGFTHVCAKSRSGRFQLKRITDSKRSRAKLHALRGELRRRRDRPIPDQGRWLASVLRGHANYYGVPGNQRALYAFRSEAVRHWFMALRRRSQRTRLTWERMRRLRDRWLPFLQIAHPWPDARFDARTQGRSPVR